MTAMTPFAFEEQLVRTVMIEDEPWFVAKDVCAVLSIKNSRDAVENLDDDEKGVVNTDTLGGPQAVTIINESGVYALVFRSRKPQAKLFRKWVTSEVLPALRRTGRYEMPDLEPADPGQSRSMTEFSTKLRMVENYGKHLGPRAFKEMWAHLGLPTTAAFHSHGAPVHQADPDLNFGDAFAAILSAGIPAGSAGAAWETAGQVINAYMNDGLTREQANRTLGRLSLRIKHRREDPNEPEFARLYMPNHAPWLNAALKGTAYATGERRAASLLTDKTLAQRDKQGGVRGVSIALDAALSAQD